MATNLAQWISPQYDVMVSGVVERYHKGDLTLAAEVVQQHDAVHGTQSTVHIDSRKRKSELDDAERRLELAERMNRVKRVALEELAFEEQVLRDRGIYDDRVHKRWFDDKVLSTIQTNPLKLLGSERAPAEDPLVLWGVRSRAQLLGLKMAPGQDVAMGRLAAKERLRRTGEKPPKTGEPVGKKNEAVNGYTERECREWLDDLLRRELA